MAYSDPAAAPDPEDRLRAEAMELKEQLAALIYYRERGLDRTGVPLSLSTMGEQIHAALEAVVADEREACATVAEAERWRGKKCAPLALTIAKAIRARGLKE